MMKRISSLLLLCLVAVCSRAQAPAEPRSEVITDSIYSQILKTHRAYTVYLPKSYQAEPDRNYPILYLLHGMWGLNTSWVQDQKANEVEDQLAASGEACEMIIVTPMAGGNPYVSQNGYFNMPGWAYEDFFYQEFLPYIERTFRVMADKQHRAIAGLSMGGGGTTMYAQRHPDLFGAAYAMSALMDIPAGNEAPALEPESPMGKLTLSVMENSCVKYVEEADDERKAALRSVKWFVDCGDDDFLLDRNIEFFRAMRQAGIPLQFRVRDGGHTSEYWHSALYTCLPFVSRCFMGMQ